MENKVQKTRQKEGKTQQIFLGEKTLKRKNEFQYNCHKKFMLGFTSHATSYTKTETNTCSHIGIASYIHSLPWEKLYFYLTEDEYNFIINTYKTATVEEVSVNIFNMGVSSTVPGTNLTLGVWREFNRFGPTEFGENITPKVLYGLDKSTLPSSLSLRDIPVDYFGAVDETKTVENRIHYKISTRGSEHGGDEPELCLHDVIGSPTEENANRNTRQLHKIIYNPEYGRFHDQTYVPDKMFLSTGHTEACTASSGSHTIVKPYEDATIENQMHNSMRGIGVGLIPRRHQGGTMEETSVELWIETEIRIRVEGLREF